MANYGPLQITQLGAQVYAQTQAGAALTFTSLAIGGGMLTTTLTTALVSGDVYVSLAVVALTSPVANGQTLTIGTGSTTQQVTATANAAIGATAIAVGSFTANANYAIGTNLTLVANPAALTALLNPVGTFAINDIAVSGSTAQVIGVFQNAALLVPTYACEIGLFATDPATGSPILYAYANAGTEGDTFPAASSGPFSRQFVLGIAIGNATSVTATIPTGPFVLQSAVGAASGVASLDATGNVPVGELGNIPAIVPASPTTAGILKVAQAMGGTPVGPVLLASTTPTETQVTTTGGQVVLSATLGRDGNVRISGSFRLTASCQVTLAISWTDGGGTLQNVTWYASSGALAAGTYLIWLPATLFATTASAVTLTATVTVINVCFVAATMEGV